MIEGDVKEEVEPEDSQNDDSKTARLISGAPRIDTHQPCCKPML